MTRRLAYFTACLLLAGCAETAVRPVVETQEVDKVWRIREVALLDLEDWDLRGRLAVRATSDGGQADLRWQRRPDKYQIDLRGPLGRGLVRLEQDKNGVRLTDGARNEYHAQSGERLLAETLGWQVPVDALHYWVRGLPIPNVPHQHELDAHGRIVSLFQSGWEVRFLGYGSYGIYELPTKMTLTPKEQVANLGNAGRLLEARIVIEQWILSPSAPR